MLLVLCSDAMNLVVGFKSSSGLRHFRRVVSSSSSVSSVNQQTRRSVSSSSAWVHKVMSWRKKSDDRIAAAREAMVVEEETRVQEFENRRRALHGSGTVSRQTRRSQTRQHDEQVAAREKLQASLAAQRAAKRDEELKECTFRPRLAADPPSLAASPVRDNSLRSPPPATRCRLDAYTPMKNDGFFRRSVAWQEAKEARRSFRAQVRTAEEDSELTFQPKISGPPHCSSSSSSPSSPSPSPSGPAGSGSFGRPYTSARAAPPSPTTTGVEAYANPTSQYRDLINSTVMLARKVFGRQLPL